MYARAKETADEKAEKNRLRARLLQSKTPAEVEVKTFSAQAVVTSWTASAIHRPARYPQAGPPEATGWAAEGGGGGGGGARGDVHHSGGRDRCPAGAAAGAAAGGPAAVGADGGQPRARARRA